MKFLFIHNNCPAQFIHLVDELSRQGHKIVFISNYRRSDININNLKHISLPPIVIQKNLVKSESHKTSQEMFYRSEAFASIMVKLKNDDFIPDIVIAHPGWGGALYVKDIFPDALYVIYCEWFYNKGELHSFFKNKAQAPSAYAANRHRNFYQLDALCECDLAITPTQWQYDQYPREFASKIHVVHDGIDANFFSPDREENSKLRDMDLSSFSEIVTYATRGMEPYRGFPQFYQAIPKILKERPQCHVVVMADDKVCYSSKRKDGKSWLQAMQTSVQGIDMERLHILNYGNYHDYRKLLRFSTVHIYLTVPFILSWSLLEAMSCGCLVVASDTTPVKEIVNNQKNGFLTSFSDSKTIANSVVNVLKNADLYHKIKFNARKTILDKYNIKKTVPLQVKLIQNAYQKKICN